MKSQKLAAKDIKIGDRIIAISKSGKTRAIVEVSYLNKHYLTTLDNNDYCFDKTDFYICPPAFTIVPNKVIDGHAGIMITKPDYAGDVWYTYGCGDQGSTCSYKKSNLECTIPDEPEYKEITIVEIEAKFGYKVKIVENER